MGNPPDNDRAAAADAGNISPGQRLRLAREARQLTREAVAAQMRIEPKVIEALERDDYTQLPAAVFVRGYLRAYGKLVGLESEPLVNAFDQRTVRTPPPLVLPAAIGLEIESRRGYARWIVFALAVLSLLLFYQWWHLEGGKPSRVAAVPPIAVPQARPQPQPQPQQSVPVPAPAPDTGAETPAAVPSPEPGTPLENLYDTPADESGLGDVTASPPVPATTPPASPTPAPDAHAPATDGNAEHPPQPAESQPQAASATGPLTLRFNADCWVVVRDAGGRALLQGLITAGQQRVLDGKPPFQLTLGNAPAVDIEYQGQRFDQSRYTGPSRIARFTLGK